MTRKDGNFVIIEAQPDGKCDLCGSVEETRPYGPNGEEVCFTCGMKNEAAMERQFGAMIGHNPFVIDLRPKDRRNGKGQ
jgi:hypothetical protein